MRVEVLRSCGALSFRSFVCPSIPLKDIGEGSFVQFSLVIELDKPKILFLLVFFKDHKYHHLGIMVKAKTGNLRTPCDVGFGRLPPEKRQRSWPASFFFGEQD